MFVEIHKNEIYNEVKKIFTIPRSGQNLETFLNFSENNNRKISEISNEIIEYEHYQIRKSSKDFKLIEAIHQSYGSRVSFQNINFEKEEIKRVCNYVVNIISFHIVESMSLDNTLYQESNKSFVITKPFKMDEQNWYRGQTNYNWKLLPSFYRTIKTNAPNIETVDVSYLYEDYKNNDIIRKYNKAFEPLINTKNDINYYNLSYLQHSISYTPLLDFTNHKYIAASFALGNIESVYDYNNIDSADFELTAYDIKENTIDQISDINNFLQNQFRIFICDKYVLGTDVGGNEISTISKLVNILTPKYKLLGQQTNDRMRYQKGKFILFYDCLVVGGNILVELNSNLSIFKHKLESAKKRRTDDLGTYNNGNYKDDLHNSYPEFDIDNLLDPYKFIVK